MSRRTPPGTCAKMCHFRANRATHNVPFVCHAGIAREAGIYGGNSHASSSAATCSTMGPMVGPTELVSS